MNEEQARTKWCPMTRVFSGRDKDASKCIASGCMMWQPTVRIWHFERGNFLEIGESYSALDKVEERYDNSDGYCGLGGKL
jgi:hypothetical protein